MRAPLPPPFGRRASFYGFSASSHAAPSARHRGHLGLNTAPAQCRDEPAGSGRAATQADRSPAIAARDGLNAVRALGAELHDHAVEALRDLEQIACSTAEVDTVSVSSDDTRRRPCV